MGCDPFIDERILFLLIAEQQLVSTVPSSFYLSGETRLVLRHLYWSWDWTIVRWFWRTNLKWKPMLVLLSQKTKSILHFFVGEVGGYWSLGKRYTISGIFWIRRGRDGWWSYLKVLKHWFTLEVAFLVHRWGNVYLSAALHLIFWGVVKVWSGFGGELQIGSNDSFELLLAWISVVTTKPMKNGIWHNRISVIDLGIGWIQREWV